MSGGPAFYDVSLSDRFPGDESELENTKQGADPTARRMTVDKDETEKR